MVTYEQSQTSCFPTVSSLYTKLSYPAAGCSFIVNSNIKPASVFSSKYTWRALLPRALHLWCPTRIKSRTTSLYNRTLTSTAVPVIHCSKPPPPPKHGDSVNQLIEISTAGCSELESKCSARPLQQNVLRELEYNLNLMWKKQVCTNLIYIIVFITYIR